MQKHIRLMQARLHVQMLVTLLQIIKNVTTIIISIINVIVGKKLNSMCIF
jgi:hypothetical protein